MFISLGVQRESPPVDFLKAEAKTKMQALFTFALRSSTGVLVDLLVFLTAIAYNILTVKNTRSLKTPVHRETCQGGSGVQVLGYVHM